MELKTKITAEDGEQQIIITREFDLPLHLLFKAYQEAEFVEQWMGNKVLKLDSRTHGSYQFETKDPHGNVVFSANGVIHQFIPNRTIVRTFEMENTPFPAQLEFLEFEELGVNKSKLTMLVIYKSAAIRDQMLQLPFAQGINMAHNKLQKTMLELN
jgi:uncharacterized protein YndB with AHSA1/START domain